MLVLSQVQDLFLATGLAGKAAVSNILTNCDACPAPKELSVPCTTG